MPKFDFRALSLPLKLMITAGLVLLLILAFILLSPKPRIAFDRIGYLFSDSVTNVWVVDPNTPESAQQLTFAENGVFDFAPSPDGRSLVYSEQTDTGLHELVMLDLTSGSTRQLTHCEPEGADCVAPAWRPDGQTIAYERLTLESVEEESEEDSFHVHTDERRIWLLDVSSGNTFPLFTEEDILGYGAVWAGDGSRIALYDWINQHILVYNYNAASENEALDVIEWGNGNVGALSPDGTQLAYPELVMEHDAQMRAALRLADLDSGDFHSLTAEDELVNDLTVTWHPDGKRVTVSRQYLDERYTLGYQVYMLDVTTNSMTPLIYDENYTHGAMSWNADGTQLVIQRTAIPTAMAAEIWVYTLATGELKRVASDGFIPRWIPAMNP